MEVRRWLVYPRQTMLDDVEIDISSYTVVKVDMVHDCRSGFAILPPKPLQEQPVVLLLLEGTLVSWSLVMDEHGGYEDLRGSDP
jgi:hypothetical protein